MNPQKTGALIATLRKEKGMTQKDLAKELHVTHTAVSKWERGLSFPDISLLEPLAQVLGLAVTELLQGQISGASKEPVPYGVVERLVVDTVRLGLEVEAARKKAAGRVRIRLSLMGLAILTLLSILYPSGYVCVLPGGRWIHFTFLFGYLLCHPVALVSGILCAGELLAGLVQWRQAGKLDAKLRNRRPSK